MDKEPYLSAFRRDNESLTEAARLGLDVPVPSCPGWVVANIVIHLGTVFRGWIAVIDAAGAEWPLDVRRRVLEESFPELVDLFEEGEKGATARDVPPGVIEWFEAGAAQLEKTLAQADLHAPFWRPPQWPPFGQSTNLLYLRAANIETAVHRWDAQLAHGRTEPVDRLVAELGIDQAFSAMIPGNRWFVREFREQPAPQGQGETYLFRQLDGERVWRVRFEGDSAVVDAEPGESGVTVAGSASDLLLFLWHRIPAERLEVAGDGALLDRYFELAPPL